MIIRITLDARFWDFAADFNTPFWKLNLTLAAKRRFYGMTVSERLMSIRHSPSF